MLTKGNVKGISSYLEGGIFSKLAFYLEGRYLDDYETHFVHKVEEDITCFYKKSNADSVLIFPPLISRIRLLVHKLVDNFYFPHLCSFSIGQDDERRVIIGSTERIIRCSLPYACIHKKLYSTSKTLQKLSDCICLQRIKSLLAQDTTFATFMSTYDNAEKIVENDVTNRKMPKMKEDSKAVSRDRHKRPDKQLYVPRALRKSGNKNVTDEKNFEKSVNKDKGELSLQITLDPKSVGNDPSFQNEEQSKIKVFKTSNLSLGDILAVEQSNELSLQTSDLNIIKNSSVKTLECKEHSSASCTEQKSSNLEISVTKSNVDNELMNMNLAEEFPVISVEKGSTDINVEIESTNIDANVKLTDINVKVESTDINLNNESININTKNKPSNINPGSRSNDISLENKSTDISIKNKSIDIDAKKKSTEFNDTMHAATFDELENNSQCIEFLNSSAESNLKKIDLKMNAMQSQDLTVKTNNSPEDSWETKFNDEGDCLDPKFVEELCDVTGRIELTVSKGDYSDYQPASKISSKEFMYDNIVELYGFPVEFKTQDLTSAFSSFQDASYNIKWVDDTHALAIFSTPVIASQALHLSHPFIKVRPLSDGIKESKEKARFCAGMFEPYKPRPVTSAVLARRLVSGALGLKDGRTREQRAIERNMLREAKEKKKLKAKQRQDIWNGIVS